MPALAFADVIDRYHRWLVRRPGARLVTNGERLYRRYGLPGRGRAVVSATLLDREVGSVKRTRPAPPPWQLLYVGFLRPEKGVHILIEACHELFAERPGQLELVIVGAVDPSERGTGDDLKRRL